MRGRKYVRFGHDLLVIGFFTVLLLSAMAGADSLAAEVLSGRVIDGATGKSLVNANVFVQDTEIGALSNVDGHFSLPDPPSDSFVLVVTSTGYRPLLMDVSSVDVASGRELELLLYPKVHLSEEVVVTASRYGSDVHLTQTNLSRDEIRHRQSDADIPMLLEDIPGVYSYNDSGTGVGYTYLNIRGFDQRRVGVMINGIPLNDPEDHQVYWVDMPDLASSLEDVQVQRGVTNSVGGMSSIGGTVNLLTEMLATEPKGRMQVSGGSFGSNKQMISYQSGLIDGRWSTAMRASHLGSDGFRNNTAADMWAVFWSGRYITPNSSTEVNIYTGREQTGFGWYGTYEGILESDRQHNPITYANAIDDFKQPHYELHHSWQLSEATTLDNSFFYIHGRGFYESFKDDRDVADYGLEIFYTDPDDPDEVDLVRRKWVNKNQIGWLPRLTHEHGSGKLIIGGDAYVFDSHHWGDVLWAEGLEPADLSGGHRYHSYSGDKTAWSVFANERFDVTRNLTLLVDLQFQHRTYDFIQNEVAGFQGSERHAYSVDHDFFNPKAGLFWRLPGRTAGGTLAFYGNVGQTHREPADTDMWDTWTGPDDYGVLPLFADYIDVADASGGVAYRQWSNPYVTEEKVIDYEFGTVYRGNRLSVTLNGYWMDFDGEILPSGGVNDNGQPIKSNVDRTLHRGLELSLALQPVADHMVLVGASRSWDEYDRFIFKEPVYDDSWNIVGATDIDYSGNPIPLFPDYMVTMSWRGDWGALDTNVRLRSVGSRYLDSTGDESRTIDDYTTLDLTFGLNLGETGLKSLDGIRIDARARNLTDEMYETWGYFDPWGDDGAGRYLIPAAGRNYLIGVSCDF